MEKLSVNVPTHTDFDIATRGPHILAILEAETERAGVKAERRRHERTESESRGGPSSLNTQNADAHAASREPGPGSSLRRGEQYSPNRDSGIGSPRRLSEAEVRRETDRLVGEIPTNSEYDIEDLGERDAAIYEALCLKTAEIAQRRRHRRGNGERESESGSERSERPGSGWSSYSRETAIHPAFREPGLSRPRGGFLRRDQDPEDEPRSPPRRVLRPDVFRTPESPASTTSTPVSSGSETRSQLDHDQAHGLRFAEFSEEEIDLISLEYRRLFPPGVRLRSSFVQGPTPTDSVVYKRLIYKLHIRLGVQRAVRAFGEENAEMIEMNRRIRDEELRAARRERRRGESSEGFGKGLGALVEERRERVQNRHDRATQNDSELRRTSSRNQRSRSVRRNEKGKKVQFDSSSFAGSGSSDQTERAAHRPYTDTSIETVIHELSPRLQPEPRTPARSSSARTGTNSFERVRRDENGGEGPSNWHTHAVIYERPAPLPGWNERGAGGPSSWHTRTTTRVPPRPLQGGDGNETGTSSGRREERERVRGGDRFSEGRRPRSAMRRREKDRE